MKNSCQILNDGKNDGKDGYEKRMKKTCEKFITLHNGNTEVMLLVITIVTYYEKSDLQAQKCTWNKIQFR